MSQLQKSLGRVIGIGLIVYVTENSATCSTTGIMYLSSRPWARPDNRFLGL